MSNVEKKSYTLKHEGAGEVKIADDVVAMIAGLAASDVEGVVGTVAGIPTELAKKMGFKMTGGGIKSTFIDGEVVIDMSIILKYGYNVVDVSSHVQEKVKNAISNMTGFKVSNVNIKVAGINVE